MKQCKRCGETKPLDEFPRSTRCRDGRIGKCKVCTNAYARAYYKQNPKAYAETRRAWETANPEKRYDYVRKWRATHPEQARESAKRTSQKLRSNGYFREWYQQHAEQLRKDAREQMRQFRKQYPELERERKLRYRRNNAEIVRLREREKTYARRAKQPYSRELAQLMAQLIELPCTYCGAHDNITIDHIVPLSRDGRHEASNLAPACFSCNSSKSDRLLSEWNGRF